MVNLRLSSRHVMNAVKKMAYNGKAHTHPIIHMQIMTSPSLTMLLVGESSYLFVSGMAGLIMMVEGLEGRRFWTPRQGHY